jgi:hypothetical protein
MWERVWSARHRHLFQMGESQTIGKANLTLITVTPSGKFVLLAGPNGLESSTEWIDCTIVKGSRSIAFRKRDRLRYSHEN